MFYLHSVNNKTWGEMTPEERKVFFIFVGIIIVGLIGYGIYYYFKNRKK